MKRCFAVIFLWVVFAGCAVQPEAIATVPVARPTETAVPPASTPLPTDTPEPTETAVPTSTLIPSPSPTIFPLQKVGELSIKVYGLTISRDGTFLVITDEGLFYAHDLTTQKIKWQFKVHESYSQVVSLDVSPNGDLLATGGISTANGLVALGDHELVFVWDTQTGELLYSFPVPYLTIENVSFSSNGQYLAASSIDTLNSGPGFMVWDMNTGQLVEQFDSSEYGFYVMDIAFLPNQPNLLALTTSYLTNEPVDGASALYFWDIEGQQLEAIVPGTWGFSMAISPNGQLLVAEIDDQLHLWDFQNHTEVQLLTSEDLGHRLAHLTITNTGRVARLAEWGEPITIWNSQGEIIATLETDKKISDIAFTPNGDLLIASYEGNGNDGASPVEVWQINE